MLPLALVRRLRSGTRLVGQQTVGKQSVVAPSRVGVTATHDAPRAKERVVSFELVLKRTHSPPRAFPLRLRIIISLISLSSILDRRAMSAAAVWHDNNPSTLVVPTLLQCMWWKMTAMIIAVQVVPTRILQLLEVSFLTA